VSDHNRNSSRVATRTLALRAGSIAALVVMADEVLKVFVRAQISACDVHALAPCERLELLGPLRIVRAENAGSALGYAQGWQVWLLLAAIGLLLVPLYARRLRNGAWLAATGVGLQLGGAAGNLLDRLLLGAATDMLYVGYGVVWNLADVALATGTLLATWVLVRATRAPTAG
jgi:signal peptidase II